MRSGFLSVEQTSIPSGDAVAALAQILTHMNGPKSPDVGVDNSIAADCDTETLGYSIEAHAILDQLAIRGFVISRAKDITLGPKVRDTAAARFTAF
jgi:hypothetical protein